jgi:hypothetical protein
MHKKWELLSFLYCPCHLLQMMYVWFTVRSSIDDLSLTAFMSLGMHFQGHLLPKECFFSECFIHFDLCMVLLESITYAWYNHHFDVFICMLDGGPVAALQLVTSAKTRTHQKLIVQYRATIGLLRQFCLFSDTLMRLGNNNIGTFDFCIKDAISHPKVNLWAASVPTSLQYQLLLCSLDSQSKVHCKLLFTPCTAGGVGWKASLLYCMRVQ